VTDWREHDGGPQPVADDVWICIDAMPEEMEEVGAGYARLPKQVGSWKHVTGFFVLNQHLIDAARLEGIGLGLEAAHKAICALPVTPESDPERVQDDCADSIAYDLMINIDTIAREARDMGSDTSAGTTA